MKTFTTVKVSFKHKGITQKKRSLMKIPEENTYTYKKCFGKYPLFFRVCCDRECTCEHNTGNKGEFI